MKKEYQLTQAGVEELRNELTELEQKAVSVAEEISTARDQGDLRENAEYQNAKAEQEKIAGRIREIQNILNNVEVIEKAAVDVVSIGNFVQVEINGTKEQFQIVGSVEADPLSKKISNQSPIGSAMIDKKVGDTFSIDMPAGKVNYKIVKIS